MSNRYRDSMDRLHFTQEQKQQYINQRVEAYGMVRGKLIGANGICAYDGTDYSDRDYLRDPCRERSWYRIP